MTLSINTELPSLAQLPKTFAVQLDDFSAISLSGEEQTKYLQGQVTCDVNSSDEHSLHIGAHCDAKGKVFSVFRLINRTSECLINDTTEQKSAHLLLQPKETIEASLKALKKFGVFAKVTIEETEQLSFYALVGDQTLSLLQSLTTELSPEKTLQIPDSLSPVIQVGSTTLVYISGQQSRYLLIDETDKLTALMTKISLPIYQQAVWQLLEINQGFPLLCAKSSSQYVPQMLNLQAINGISFTKGCYLGQETVARMQYLGKNKRALFSLNAQLEQPLETDDIIEKQLGENWRKAGDILASYQADDGSCEIQAILSNDNEQPNLRIKSQAGSTVTLATLPYSLTNKAD